ncbi:DUF2179 domain-containing protein [Petrotoga olearia]|uniref:UPF0316 protein X929_08890 n=2 Tax=Petrotoga olearia TaxID=156203 RepID=A0A2K1NWR6_9BACT|nr:DUF2179 domain-containing protein [Petrotoga olearia]PNR94982.1 hypothetical protein X929_08890 [Petrotoga olearia DSM 13574]RMA73287.1 uncharacterized protein YebE (UPF0316 family) [Petrotoga olearia]
MQVSSFVDSTFFSLVIFPIIIFAMRLCDVSLMTIRIIFVSKGIKFWASVLGFFEIMVWLIAISQVMNNLDKPLYAIAYALGFATGNYLGAFLEEKIAIGVNLVRVITNKEAQPLVDYLNKEGFGVTSIDAEGSKGPVKIIYSVVRRKDLKKIIDIVNEFNPNAFYSIEEVRGINKGIFPPQNVNFKFRNKLTRKGK